MFNTEPVYDDKKKGLPQRVYYKHSGKAISSEGKPYDDQVSDRVIAQYKVAHQAGKQLMGTIGGGNAFRGAEDGPKHKVSPPYNDRTGMMVMAANANYTCGKLVTAGMEVQIFTPSGLEFAEFIRHSDYAVEQCLSERKIAYDTFGLEQGGFSSDTVAALRAGQAKVDLFVKFTNVNGAFDKDPNAYGDATWLPLVDYHDALACELRIMDNTAFATAQRFKLRILVVNYTIDPHELLSLIDGKIPLKNASLIGDFPTLRRVRIDPVDPKQFDQMDLRLTALP